jgi:hypothetical protein
MSHAPSGRNRNRRRYRYEEIRRNREMMEGKDK